MTFVAAFAACGRSIADNGLALLAEHGIPIDAFGQQMRTHRRTYPNTAPIPTSRVPMMAPST